jgi:hypothetical protein
MSMKALLVIALIGLLAVSVSFAASCSAETYSKVCSSCPFDKDGKVDKSCSDAYQASGTACVSIAYPIMAGKYAQGQCPEVDACADELRACNAQYSSGNDKEDCAEGSKSVCYAAADQCVQTAAIKCGEAEKQCPGSSAGLVLLLLGLGFVSLKGKA